MPPPHLDDNGGPAPKRSRSSHEKKHTNEEEDLAEDGGGGGGGGGERTSYPVKKYRPDTYYRSIEAFARYTKSHRMLDATYVQWTHGGATHDRPHVFGIRIAGSFLSWGRGKTRDAAIDAAIRAAFALVAAHGYDDFTLTEDCFTEEPYDVPNSMAPMPPPPPPLGFGRGGGMMMMMMGGGLGGGPPLPPGMPPPPPGMPPNFSGLVQLPPGGSGGGPPPPLGMPPSFTDEALIPQPVAPNANLAVASTVVVGDGSASSVGGVTSMKVGGGASSSIMSTPTTGSSKGLVFGGGLVDENGEEMSMEEMRMRLPRFQFK